MKVCVDCSRSALNVLEGKKKIALTDNDSNSTSSTSTNNDDDSQDSENMKMPALSSSTSKKNNTTSNAPTRTEQKDSVSDMNSVILEILL